MRKRGTMRHRGGGGGKSEGGDREREKERDRETEREKESGRRERVLSYLCTKFDVPSMGSIIQVGSSVNIMCSPLSAKVSSPI